MYAPPPVARNAAPARGGILASGPLLAVCCLLFILFLIAATVVLALIPVYVSSKDGPVSSGRAGPYSAVLTPTSTDLVPGTLTADANTNVGKGMDSALGIPSGTVQVASGTSVAANGRRKRRGFGLTRQRRDIVVIQIIFYFLTAKCSKCGKSSFHKSIGRFSFTAIIWILDALGIVRGPFTTSFAGVFSTDPSAITTIASTAATATAKLAG